MRIQKKTIGLIIYLGLLLLPIYWMLNMSLRTNADILAQFSLFPTELTLQNYITIFTEKRICKISAQDEIKNGSQG